VAELERFEKDIIHAITPKRALGKPFDVDFWFSRIRSAEKGDQRISMATSKDSLPQLGALHLIGTALKNSAEEPCKMPMRPSYSSSSKLRPRRTRELRPVTVYDLEVLNIAVMQVGVFQAPRVTSDR
jgi:hypothetical protein